MNINERTAINETEVIHLKGDINALTAEIKSLGAQLSSTLRSLTQDRVADSIAVNEMRRDLTDIKERMKRLEVRFNDVDKNVSDLSNWRNGIYATLGAIVMIFGAYTAGLFSKIQDLWMVLAASITRDHGDKQ